MTVRNFAFGKVIISVLWITGSPITNILRMLPYPFIIRTTFSTLDYGEERRCKTAGVYHAQEHTYYFFFNVVTFARMWFSITASAVYHLSRVSKYFIQTWCTSGSPLAFHHFRLSAKALAPR